MKKHKFACWGVTVLLAAPWGLHAQTRDLSLEWGVPAPASKSTSALPAEPRTVKPATGEWAAEVKDLPREQVMPRVTGVNRTRAQPGVSSTRPSSAILVVPTPTKREPPTSSKVSEWTAEVQPLQRVAPELTAAKTPPATPAMALKFSDSLNRPPVTSKINQPKSW